MDESKKGGENKAGAQTFDLRERNVLRLWSLFFLIVLFVLFLLLLWKAIPVLLLLFSGALIALALRFISDVLSRWTHIPPLVMLTILLVVIVGGGVGGLIVAAPTITEQFRELGANLQESLADLEGQIRESKAASATVEWLSGFGGEDGPEIWETVAGAFTTTFGATAAFFLTLVVGVFLAYNPGLYVRGFLRLIPLGRRRRAREIMTELADVLRWWMVGQLISMIVLGVTTWLMLLILGVPLAFILGFLTGVLTFIPYLGPFIALIPILLVALAESPTLMWTVLALYLVIQNIESNVLMPIIFQQTVHLPPVLTIVAQILLGAIFGFVGIVLATPLMAAGITLVKMIYVEDVLEDSMEDPVKVPDP